MRHPLPSLHVITVGHVDHGKSTLLGRLLYETDALSHEQKKALESTAANHAEIEWAFLLDAFLEEQMQNITIDTTQLVFRTPRRDYVMIDAPGHEEFIKNMIAGATRADAALLILDVKEGIQAQTKRHLQLLSLLGITQITVLLNKMDLIHYEESLFRKREKELEKLCEYYHLFPQQMIPIVARYGENFMTHSANMHWYQGPTLMEALDQMKRGESLESQPLRFMVQDVYRFQPASQRRVIVGRVESGVLRVGEEIVFWPGGKKSHIASLEAWGSEKQPDTAIAGASVAITLKEPLFVERGHVGSSKDQPPCEGYEINAQIFWLDAEPLLPHQPITLQLGTESLVGRIVSIKEDAVNTPTPTCISQHHVVDVVIRMTQPLLYDCYNKIPPTGRFALVLQGRLVGGGVIKASEKCLAATTTITSDHLAWNASAVDQEMRKKRLGHSGMVLWLTGLSGSGKSTIARELELLLHQQRIASVILDGDNLRQGLCADLGFSLEDRAENIRRTGEVAQLFAQAGMIAICALISPLRDDRSKVQKACLQKGILFKEIFIDAPLEVCEARDPRGLYRKARQGEIPSFTGISSPYEDPLSADMHLFTAHFSSQEITRQLYLKVLTWLEEEDSFQT